MHFSFTTVNENADELCVSKMKFLFFGRKNENENHPCLYHIT